MLERKTTLLVDLAGKVVEPAMPLYVGSEDQLVSALAAGDADIQAGRVVPFDDIAAELRQNYGKD